MTRGGITGGVPAGKPPPLLLAALLALCAAACGEVQEDPRDQSYEIQTPLKYRSMTTVVPSGTTVTVSGAGITGVFVKDRVVILGAYSLAKYETTWQLWKEVYDWAVRRGYSFANAGTEGHGTSGTGGSGWAASSRTSRPVTGVSWYDAIVWCNAYSELCGYEPVYYTEDGAGVLRVSKGGETESGSVTARRDRNGFRLPLETEWEFAARGGKTGDGDWNNYIYSGGNAVDGLAWYALNAGTEGSIAYGAHAAGGKTANRLGVFDMSGNAAEWCWDRYDDGPVTQETPPDGVVSGQERVVRGGSWSDNAAACEVKARSCGAGGYAGPDTGFRAARTLPDEGEVVNSGDYLPTLEGTHWYWDSPWGFREIDFGADGQAVFTDPAEPPPVYNVSYTYNPALGRGNISGSYPAGDFQLRNKNKTMYFPQFRHFGHSVEFTFQENE